MATPAAPGPHQPAPPRRTRVFLTGYRGTGKTTVARLLAGRLGWRWVDTDDLVEQAAGEPIAAIFAGRGEPAFRDLEQQAVADACRREQAVIALGGGAILREASRQTITQAGPVIWLTASAEALWRRIEGDAATAGRRPNLTTAGGVEEVRGLLAERAPLYRECATLVLDTEGKPPEDLAEEAARWLEAHPRS